METTKPKRGRPRQSAESIYTISGQIEAAESDAINALSSRIYRTRSYIVRAAVIILLREDAAGRIDWSKSLENQR